ncbi:MAG: hypothetical protein V4502_02660 [Pseudomonadota bacterium]
MIGPDPIGPDGLNDLQREELGAREQLERKPRSPFDNDYEPETLREAHWWVQPKWVKYFSLAVGLPVGLFWAYEVKYGDIFALDPRVSDICFGVFFAIAALQLFFIFRA